MMNHINSTARARLKKYTPFKLAQILLNSSLLEKLSLKHIAADEVHLKPSLKKKINFKNFRTSISGTYLCKSEANGS